MLNAQDHGLRTPNEVKNLRKLRFWADVADKIFFGCALISIIDDYTLFKKDS